MFVMMETQKTVMDAARNAKENQDTRVQRILMTNILDALEMTND